MAAKTEIQQRMQNIEELLGQVEAIQDGKTRTQVIELIQSLMDFHAAGLNRMMEIASEAGEPGLKIIDALGRDRLASCLLLLYGLHPVEFETRVREALDRVSPYLKSHGGNVELLAIRDGIVRLRLHGSCHGCASSTLTLKSVIEEAICEAAPDVAGIELDDSQPAMAPDLIPLQAVRTRNDSRPAEELKVIN